ncbi:MAG: sulfur carrier protein ThiS [Nevskiaceae bacterium]|nr:MAG: sulfur carrier protein ThiS [Nevskiaceae bacterium]TBR75303.1 MAG: sulfur carrier protein ThiS [Nevskiaceae bacterium]
MTVMLNGAPHPCGAGTSVADVLREIVPAGRRVAVELNGEVLPRAEHATRRLVQGDALEVVQAIGGG